jgi:hypothetical protein
MNGGERRLPGTGVDRTTIAVTASAAATTDATTEGALP